MTTTTEIRPTIGSDAGTLTAVRVERDSRTEAAPLTDRIAGRMHATATRRILAAGMTPGTARTTWTGLTFRVEVEAVRA